MTLLSALGVFNYGLVLIYGLILSVAIAGGCRTARQKRIFIALAPLFLLIQTPCWLILGVTTAKQLYPLIVHLPLTLALICVLKKRVGEAIVCTCTAYLCCQLPRWVNIAVTAVSGSALAGEICYTLSIVPFLFALLQQGGALVRFAVARNPHNGFSRGLADVIRGMHLPGCMALATMQQAIFPGVVVRFGFSLIALQERRKGVHGVVQRLSPSLNE